MIFKYIDQQIQEIKESPALKNYGLMLALSLVINAVYWAVPGSPLITVRQMDSEAICWPGLFICFTRGAFFAAFIKLGLIVMLCSAFAAVFAFAWRRAQGAYIFLALSFVAKICLYFQDYRLMGNYHLIQNWVIFIYLVFKNRSTVIATFLVLSYFFAGLLKLNLEWLSGAGLARVFLIEPPYLHFLLGLAILLEIIGSWYLLSRSKTLFLYALILFFLFHGISYFVVGPYYPSIQFCLLSLFIFQAKDSGLGWFDLKRISFSGIAILGLFVLINVLPHLQTGDSALTSNAKIISVNMLETTPDCRALLYVSSRSRTEEIDLTRTDLPPRGRCDAALYWRLVKNYCEAYKSSTESQAETKAERFVLVSKRATDPELSQIVNASDPCESMKSYSLLGWNSWVSFKQASKNELVTRFNDELVNIKVASSDSLTPVQFRGDQARDGAPEAQGPFEISRVKKSWTAINGNVGVHGASKSSPVSNQDRVVVAGDSGWVYSYDLNGNLQWQTFLDSPQRGIHSTPVLTKDIVYVGSYSGRFYALSSQTGKLIWTTYFKGGIGASPLLVDGAIYIPVEILPPNGFLAKLNSLTGEVLWKSALVGQHPHSSGVYNPKNNSIVFGSNAGNLTSVDAATGNTLWTKRIGGEIKSTPALFENKLYVTNWAGTLVEVSAETGEIYRSASIGGKIMSSPTVLPKSRQLVFSNDKGVVYGLSLDSFQTLWSFREELVSLKGSGRRLNLQDGGEAVVIPCSSRNICFISIKGTILAKIPTQAIVDGEISSGTQAIYFSETSPGELQKWQFE